MGNLILKPLIVAGIALLSSLPTLAGGDSRTHACQDSIGYRSNLIDPFNTYSRSQYLMTTQLLHRFGYGLMPEGAIGNEKFDDEGSSDENVLLQAAYVARVLARLSAPDSHKVEKPFNKYHYAWGRCVSNDVPSAIAYIDAVYSAMGRGTSTDALIMARHRLLQLCEVTGQQAQSALIAQISANLRPLNNNAQVADWIKYLDGVGAFYKGDDDTSHKIFTSLGRSDFDWISDTADYMIVRMAKEKTDGATKIDAALAQRLEDARDAYLLAHPEGLYARAVDDLGQYLARYQSDATKLYELQATKFGEVFGKESLLSLGQRKAELFDLMLGSDVGIAKKPPPPQVVSGVDLHPFLLASILLKEISSDGSLTEANWPEITRRASTSTDSYAGLQPYITLLLHAIAGDYRKITAGAYDEATYGPLLADAILLRARAYEKLGENSSAIQTWTQLHTTTPTFNALTEIANLLVADENFSQFAYLPQGYISAFVEAQTDAGVFCETEFDDGARAFLERHDPYKHLLHEGFGNFVTPNDMALVADDSSLHPLVRYYASERAMQVKLMLEDYKGFLKVSDFLTSESFVGGLAERYSEGYEASAMIAGYTKAIPLVERLIKDPDDADALTRLGYFRYENHLTVWCDYDQTLWASNLDAYPCKNISATEKKSVAPIEMFSRALEIYKKQLSRTQEEASLLRTMIYCFKGYSNQRNCTFFNTDDYPESVRKDYFDRLKAEFSTSEQLEFWY